MAYEKALAELAKLRVPVDAFFDHCMVMAEDKKVRANRLALLAEIAVLFSQVADFSRLGTGEAGAEGPLAKRPPSAGVREAVKPPSLSPEARSVAIPAS